MCLDCIVLPVHCITLLIYYLVQEYLHYTSINNEYLDKLSKWVSEKRDRPTVLVTSLPLVS